MTTKKNVVQINDPIMTKKRRALLKQREQKFIRQWNKTAFASKAGVTFRHYGVVGPNGHTDRMVTVLLLQTPHDSRAMEAAVDLWMHVDDELPDDGPNGLLATYRSFCLAVDWPEYIKANQNVDEKQIKLYCIRRGMQVALRLDTPDCMEHKPAAITVDDTNMVFTWAALLAQITAS